MIEVVQLSKKDFAKRKILLHLPFLAIGFIGLILGVCRNHPSDY